MGFTDRKNLYVETYGCQMNEYDTLRIRKVLGMELVDDPKKADVILINTCAIREKADHKALSSVGRFKHIKRARPEVIIGVGGCVAQLYGSKLLEQYPHLDLVFGTRNISTLPQLISRIDSERVAETSFDIEELFDVEPYHEAGKVTAYVSIQTGCNKRCTYCIVPTVRGPEVNRPAESVVAEVRSLAARGAREITLIGQTVNSWRDGRYRFPDLLGMVADVDGVVRIRFTTSYPRDLTRRLIDAVREIEKVCHHIHLPVQSGSNSVLRRMKRTYTREWFLDRVARLRDAVPDIAITTDIIVGFPGETERDFEETMDLIETVRFDGTFSFKYSPRPGTEAASYDDTVDDETASRRLTRLQSRQRDITYEKNRSRVGLVEEVLVEGPSKNGLYMVCGRTTHNRIVNLPGTLALRGEVVRVRITDGYPNSLRGEVVESN